jgi:hypothetical protein
MDDLVEAGFLALGTLDDEIRVALIVEAVAAECTLGRSSPGFSP